MIPPARRELTPIYLPEETAVAEVSPIPEPEESRVPELIPAEAEMTAPETLPKLKGESDEKPGEPLLELDQAVEQVPASLREEMEELLRADFREVVRWEV